MARLDRIGPRLADSASAHAGSTQARTRAFNSRSDGLSLGPGAVAHHADGVELGLLAGVFLGPLAHLVALVEQFDLLEFLERFAEVRLRLVELARGARTPSA